MFLKGPQTYCSMGLWTFLLSVWVPKWPAWHSQCSWTKPSTDEENSPWIQGNLAKWEAKICKIEIEASLGQKVCKTPSQREKNWICWCVPVIPVMSGLLSRQLGKKTRPYLKITRAKRARGMAQVIERLPSKSKGLSSNSSTTKRWRG
jgi:hypothetical protein